ncbi:MAG: hypothetical protein RMJ36_07110 [Candidatus Calescibacterium sp.]|nr:hypothetical protein [Candidatus Calescibacterium sp.]MDW8133403.1 hypothetical protein [Candidatus Calescibacterium sp.]
MRNRILNQVSSKFGSNNYVELNPGYYVFISDDTLVYFPPSYNQVSINNYLKNAVRGYSIDKSKLPSDSIIMTNNLFDKYGRVINEIYMESFNLVIGKNIKISDTGKFLYITSWYNSSYPFGYNEISLSMENGSIIWYDKGAIIIDGIVNNDPEKGGGIIATADSTNNSLIQQVVAPTYIRNNDTIINKYWSSYRALGSGTSVTLIESSNSNISSSLKQGDIVARFSQFSQGTQNTAILLV